MTASRRARFLPEPAGRFGRRGTANIAIICPFAARIVSGGKSVRRPIQQCRIFCEEQDYYNDNVYKICLCALFFLVGTVFIRRYLYLVYKQVLIICFLNVILMTLQVSGAGKWTQFMATEGEKTSYPTLFVQEKYLQASTVQRRPSGFLHSNNYLSIIVLFGMALHFSRNKNKLKWGTCVLIAMGVLSMAKIVFLVYILMGIAIFLRGNKVQKVTFANSLLLAVGYMYLYFILFPGLFSSQMNYYHITYSLFIRMNNIIDAFDKNSVIAKTIEPLLKHTPKAPWANIGDNYISGYTPLVKHFFWIMSFGAILLICIL